MPETSLIQCPACRSSNRVPTEKIARGLVPICGRCKQRLPIHNAPLTVTDETFATQVERSSLPVLVDAWAPWCGPCRMIGPMIDELAAELAGRLRVAKLNVDDNPVSASRFNLRSIPTLLIMQGGREIDRIVGVQPKADIRRRLQRVLT